MPPRRQHSQKLTWAVETRKEKEEFSALFFVWRRRGRRERMLMASEFMSQTFSVSSSSSSSLPP